MRLVLVAALAASVAACATSAPPASTPGVVGKFADGRTGRLVRVDVLNADAESCTLGASLPARTSGESFDFVDDGRLGDVLSPLDVSCKLAGGETIERTVKAVLDEKQFGRDRATQVVMTGLIAGPLGAAASAAMSGSMKGRYYRIPNLIHVAPAAEMATTQQRDSLRDKANAEWTQLLAKFEQPKSQGAMPISKDALLMLRQADLSFFDEPASATAAAAAAAQP